MMIDTNTQIAELKRKLEEAEKKIDLYKSLQVIGFYNLQNCTFYDDADQAQGHGKFQPVYISSRES